MRTLRYCVIDVFTDRALAGNPLIVFTDARALDAATMQALARETNLSETAFVQAPEAGGQARVRIFTPTRELPFAGHPVLGTAYVLGGPLQSDEVRLETGRGVVPVRLEREGARIVFGWMRPAPPELAPVDDPDAVCRALGVAGSALPVEAYDNGLRHVFVALPSAEAVAALRPDPAALARLGDVGVNAFWSDGARAKTRSFAAAYGVSEDPATGSAAGPLALHLVRHGRLAYGQELEIAQGAEVGRPSTLYARVFGAAGRLDAVEVGGAAVVVGRGEFVLR
jgi:trans-2,3-dihydro-3-hydroxyanthranilate isomerase